MDSLPTSPALSLTTTTPIASLSPVLENIEKRSVHAQVILLWPFSSSTRQYSLLLSEPDFRLRGSRGQVKVVFRDQAAEAVANCQLEIGDTVFLCLNGAKWISRKDDVPNSAREIEWDLEFGERVLVEVQRQSNLLGIVEISHAEEKIVDETPQTPVHTPTGKTPARSPIPLSAGTWSSPAFSRSYLSPVFDHIAGEDGYIPGKGRKRTKFSRLSSEWVFLDTPPSPIQEDQKSDIEDLDIDGESESDETSASPSHPNETPSSSVDNATEPVTAPDIGPVRFSPEGTRTSDEVAQKEMSPIEPPIDQPGIGVMSPSYMPLDLAHGHVSPPEVREESILEEARHHRLEPEASSNPELLKDTGLYRERLGPGKPPSAETVPEPPPISDERERTALSMENVLQEPTHWPSSIYAEGRRSESVTSVLAANEIEDQDMAEAEPSDVQECTGVSKSGEEPEFQPGLEELTQEGPFYQKIPPSDEAMSSSQPEDYSDEESASELASEIYEEYLSEEYSDISPATEGIEDAGRGFYLDRTNNEPDVIVIDSDTDVESNIPEGSEQRIDRQSKPMEDGSEIQLKEETASMDAGPDVESVPKTHLESDLGTSPTKSATSFTQETNVIISQSQERDDTEISNGSFRPSPDAISLHEPRDHIELSPSPPERPLSSDYRLYMDGAGPEEHLAIPPSSNVMMQPNLTPQLATPDNTQEVYSPNFQVQPTAAEMQHAMPTPQISQQVSIPGHSYTESVHDSELEPSFDSVLVGSFSASQHYDDKVKEEPPSPPSQARGSKSITPSSDVDIQEIGTPLPKEPDTAHRKSNHDGALRSSPSQSETSELVSNIDQLEDDEDDHGKNFSGLRTSLSYFSPLSLLAETFNQPTDTLSIVVSALPISRASHNPKDYYSTLYITDLSLSGQTLCAQLFRKQKASLPVCGKGDVILLRNLKVESTDHKMMLCSTESSSWAVFANGDPSHAQMNGPPVEFGDEERSYVANLRQWYMERGQDLINRKETEPHPGSASAEAGSVTPTESSRASTVSTRGASDILKKYRRDTSTRKSTTPRRITIHELRGGRRYVDFGSPSNKNETIHELRDGTMYAHLE